MEFWHVLAASTQIMRTGGGKETHTRENKRKAENNEGNWIYY